MRPLPRIPRQPLPIPPSYNGKTQTTKTRKAKSSAVSSPMPSKSYVSPAMKTVVTAVLSIFLFMIVSLLFWLSLYFCVGESKPEWASINLGITLCIDCSGIHRGLGVHISKVRSIKLDGFEPEILKVMAEIGNDVSKRIYEAKVAEIIAKRATPDCSKEQRENWIKAKYVTRAFINTEALKVMISAGNQVLYFTFLCFLFSGGRHWQMDCAATAA